MRVADKFLAPALSVFYPAGGLISVEDIGRFALEAARGKWEGKGGPIFENTEMKKFLKGLSLSMAHGEL